jgi:hypothetical protein
MYIQFAKWTLIHTGADMRGIFKLWNLITQPLRANMWLEKLSNVIFKNVIKYMRNLLQLIDWFEYIKLNIDGQLLSIVI